MGNELGSMVNPYASPLPSPDPLPAAQVDAKNNLILASIYAIFFFYGASQVFKYEGNETYYLFSLLFVILISVWTFADIKKRDARTNLLLKVLYIITVPISTFVYLASSRGFRGVGWWILNFVAMYFVLAIGFYVAFYGLYYSGQWDLMDPVFFQ